MGMMHKFLNAMKLNTEDEYYDEEDFYDEEDAYYDEDSSKAVKASKETYHEEPARKTTNRAINKVTPMRPSKKNSLNSAMEVCVIKPTSVDDAREITETLLANRTVVLNLEGIDLEIGQRIIDFTSGSCFAVSGNLQKVSNYIFVITPSNVDLSGDFQSIVDAAFDVSSIHTDI